MKLSKHSALAALLTLGALALGAAGLAAAQAPGLQDRAAALKESLAKSQALLKQYEWIETRVMIFKGEEKQKTENRCYYGADGKIQKVVISAPEEKKARGLKGRMVEKKKAEISEYMQSAGELVKSYVPPDPARLEALKNAGKLSVTPAGSSVRLDFHDYEKPGDRLSFELDTAKNTLVGLNVDTWLANPTDKITMVTRFGELADGATYAAQTILSAPSQSLEIRTTNSGYKKL